MKRPSWKWVVTLGLGFGYRQWFAPRTSGAFHVIDVWGEHGSAPGQFNEPIGIAVDHKGFVDVADARNARIQKLDPQGRLLLEWVAYGKGPGAFEKPKKPRPIRQPLCCRNPARILSPIC